MFEVRSAEHLELTSRGGAVFGCGSAAPCYHPHSMQAVILAAGRSTRTHPLTATRPKPLIPIWDRPFLELQLAQLQGIVDEVLLVVGYRKEQIEAYFGTEHRGLRLRFVEQETQRGTADAVAAARPLVRERVLILNGDDFYHHDDLEALAADGRGLLVTQAADPQNRAVVRIEDGLITDIVEKPKDVAPGAWCSVGGYSVEAHDLDRLDDLALGPRGELELPDFIRRLADSEPVRPHSIGQWWLPLTYAINSINRSGGQQDLYPFVLAAPVRDKLAFAHRALRMGGPA